MLVCNTFVVCEQVYTLYGTCVHVHVCDSPIHVEIKDCSTMYVLGLHHHIQNDRIIELSLKVGFIHPT